MRPGAAEITTVVGREALATLRSALFPLARLDPLPAPPAVSSGPPVILVHGFLGHPDMFRPLIRRLRLAGRGEIRCVGYPSTRVSLEQIVARIERIVLKEATRLPVDLVGHSLGAVACRAWVKAFGGAPHTRRLVSLGGPHAGTDLFRLAPRRLWEVLDPDGAWVRRLAAGPEPVPTVVVRARYDHQILPPRRAALPGVPEVVLAGHGHNGLLWDARAHEAVLAALAEPGGGATIGALRPALAKG